MHRDPESCLVDAARRWGPHPSSWPVPRRDTPGLLRLFIARTEMAAERELAEVFGPVSQRMRDRFYAVSGQSPHEDAGGAMLRRYRAMLGLSYETPPTYAEVIDGLGTHAPRNMMVNDAGRPSSAPRNRGGK